MGKLVFVRHSKPVVTPHVSRALWPLSPEGRSLAVEIGKQLDLGSGVEVVASIERKAVETAELLGVGPVITDERLVEIDKPWYSEAEAHTQAVTEYVSGGHLEGWEPQADALVRFAAVIEEGGAEVFAAVVEKWEQIADVVSTSGIGDDAVTVTTRTATTRCSFSTVTEC